MPTLMLQSSLLRRELTSAQQVCILLVFPCTAFIIHTGKDRSTPLHFASSNGHTDVAKLLIQKGADMSITSVYCVHLSPHLIHHPRRPGQEHTAASCIMERPH